MILVLVYGININFLCLPLFVSLHTHSRFSPLPPQGHDGSKHYLVQAKVAILNKQFKTAERLLLEKGDSENAMNMYMELGRWEDVLAVAELTVSTCTCNNEIIQYMYMYVT